MSAKTIVFIIGLSSSGKSSISKILSSETGFALFSAGAFQREWAKQHGYLDAVEFNRKAGLEKAYFSILPDILEKIKELGRRHNGIIVEGLYTQSLLDGVSKAFPQATVRVFNLTSTRHERVKRYAEREKTSLAHAKEAMRRLDRQKRKIGLIDVQRLKGTRFHVMPNKGSIQGVVSRMRKLLPHHP